MDRVWHLGIDPRNVIAKENWNKSSHGRACQEFDDLAFVK